LAEVVTAHHEAIGGYRWRLFNEGRIVLTDAERMQLLETTLGCAPNLQNVRSLLEAVHRPDHLGWTIAGSCPAIVRVAQDFLTPKGTVFDPPKPNTEAQSILDALNRRGGAPQ